MTTKQHDANAGENAGALLQGFIPEVSALPRWARRAVRAELEQSAQLSLSMRSDAASPSLARWPAAQPQGRWGERVPDSGVRFHNELSQTPVVAWPGPQQRCRPSCVLQPRNPNITADQGAPIVSKMNLRPSTPSSLDLDSNRSLWTTNRDKQLNKRREETANEIARTRQRLEALGIHYKPNIGHADSGPEAGSKTGDNTAVRTHGSDVPIPSPVADSKENKVLARLGGEPSEPFTDNNEPASVAPLVVQEQDGQTGADALNHPAVVGMANGSTADRKCRQQQQSLAVRYLQAVETLNDAFENALEAYDLAREAPGDDSVGQTARLALERQFNAMLVCLDGLCPRRAASREHVLEALLSEYSEKLVTVMQTRLCEQ